MEMEQVMTVVQLEEQMMTVVLPLIMVEEFPLVMVIMVITQHITYKTKRTRR